MRTSPGLILLQCLAIALCAWGVVIVLHVTALLGAAIVHDEPGTVPSWLLLGTWALVAVEIVRGLLGTRPWPDGRAQL